MDYTNLNAYCGIEFNWDFDLANDRIKIDQSITPPPPFSNIQAGL